MRPANIKKMKYIRSLAIFFINWFLIQKLKLFFSLFSNAELKFFFDTHAVLLSLWVWNPCAKDLFWLWQWEKPNKRFFSFVVVFLTILSDGMRWLSIINTTLSNDSKVIMWPLVSISSTFYMRLLRRYFCTRKITKPKCN